MSTRERSTLQPLGLEQLGLGYKLSYEGLVDLLPCYISIQDPSLQLLFTNRNFREDFGDGLGKPCYRVYKGRAEKCESCPVQKSFEDKQVHISHERVFLSNGKEAQMVVYASPVINDFGGVEAVIEMSINITKVAEMQKELQRLGESIALISHDIKNTLEGLQGGAYVVDEGLKDRDTALASKGWDIVKRNVADISRITENILYACKKQRAGLQRVAPGEIVADVVELFRQQAVCMDVSLECEVEDALPFAYMDPSGIRRVLSNLIWNALEACQQDKTKADHRVAVRAKRYDRSHLALEVADNGVGMDEETRRCMFQEFYSTKGADGTGLGLMVVDKVVKEHRGRIEVKSDPGGGTVFRVILGFCLPG